MLPIYGLVLVGTPAKLSSSRITPMFLFLVYGKKEYFPLLIKTGNHVNKPKLKRYPTGTFKKKSYRWVSIIETQNKSVRTAVATMTTLDGDVVTRTYKGKARWEEEFMSSKQAKPYEVDQLRYLKHYIKERDILEDDEGVFHPKCNLKNITVKESEPFDVEVEWIHPGYKDKTWGEWVMEFIFHGIFLGFVIAVVFVVGWGIKTGLGW